MAGGLFGAGMLEARAVKLLGAREAALDPLNGSESLRCREGKGCVGEDGTEA